ncbi:MAG: glutathione S-transferase [Moraxellaceae bacterium]|nr:MAG: glutathione S-transferase [Moraxellaceae bacterium]
MIKVYGYPNTRATRITWTLEELQEGYEFKLVDFAKGDSKSKEFLAVNPAGKVPVLQDGDLTLTESGAIVTYLADKFADQKLIPSPGSPERAKFEQWSYFALCELEQPLWTLGKHRFALPKEQRVSEIFPTASWEFQQALTLLSSGLGTKNYILGSEFSAADILLGHTLIWGLAFDQTVKQENLIAYHQRLSERPALANAKAREAQSLPTEK